MQAEMTSLIHKKAWMQTLNMSQFLSLSSFLLFNTIIGDLDEENILIKFVDYVVLWTGGKQKILQQKQPKGDNWN